MGSIFAKVGKAVFIYLVADIGIGLTKHAAKAIKRTIDKKKLEKGLKDGSIVEFEGNYYEVEVV